MAVALVHDCDCERRPDPLAKEGDFRDCYMESGIQSEDTEHDLGLVAMGVVVPGGKGSEFEDRGLFLYDLKAFIPADAIITAAVWHPYIAATDAAGTHSFRAHRIRRHDLMEDHATWEAYKLYDSGTATGGTTTTIVDGGKNWTDDLTGYKVKVWYGTGYNWTTVTSNTPTQLTVSPAIGDVDAGDLYWIRTPWAAVGASDTSTDRDTGVGFNIGTGVFNSTGWKAITCTTLVNDAWTNQGGICTFIVERFDAFMSTQGYAQVHAKPPPPTDPYATTHHLRVTYTLADRTFQVMVRSHDTCLR